MAELKDVVESILDDLITAKHKANDYSKGLSAEYLKNGRLSNFSAPAVDIGNVKLDIKFFLKEQESEIAGGSVTLKPEEISRVIHESASNVLGNHNVKYRAASDGLADRESLYSSIASMISRNTDPTTLKLDKNKAVDPSVELLRPHLARDDSRHPVNLVNKLIVESENKLSKALDAAKKIAPVKPKFIVDTKKMESSDSRISVTISLDIDMTAMDSYEVE